MAGKKLTGVTPDRMKSNEAERRASGLAEKGSQAMTSVDSQFKKMTKVLNDLNKNVATLKAVEMVQLANDFNSRRITAKKEADSTKETKEHREKMEQQAPRFMVESNARNEAGLREISKRITLLHGWMAGDSEKQIAERLAISSQEHTDAIKKHRAIGMGQLDVLKGFKGEDGSNVNSITGLPDQKYIGQKGMKINGVDMEGQVITKAELKELWDAESTRIKNKMDERARQTFDEDGNVKSGIFSVRRKGNDKAKGDYSGGTFAPDDSTWDQRMKHMTKALETVPDAEDIMKMYNKSKKDIFDEKGNINEAALTAASKVLTKAYSDHVTKATTTIIDFSNTPGHKGSGGGMLGLVGGNGRFNGDTVHKDANPELLKKYLKNLGPIAADTKQIRKMMKGDLRSKEEEFEAKKALKRHQAFAGPQRPGGPGSSDGGGGFSLLGALGMGSVVAGGVGFVKRTGKWLKRKMKTFYKYAGKSTQTIMKAAVANKSLAKIKYLFAASLNPVGIAIMGAIWAFESVALDYLAEVIAEVDAEGMGFPDGSVGDESGMKVDRRGNKVIIPQTHMTDPNYTNPYNKRKRQRGPYKPPVNPVQDIIDSVGASDGSIISKVPFTPPVTNVITKDSGNSVTNNNITVYNDKMTPAEAKIVDDYLAGVEAGK